MAGRDDASIVTHIDTHCHIHDSEFLAKYAEKGLSQQALIDHALEAGVEQLVCVGTDVKSSQEAVDLAQKQPSCYASLALHPHEAADMTLGELRAAVDELESILKEQGIQGRQAGSKVVAIGEIGLDYFYHQLPDVKQRQEQLFRWQLELAQKYNLPLIFHIREAFDDFFRILDDFEAISGVVHSFTSNVAHMEQIVARGLYVGINGIMTFTKVQEQLDAARQLPLKNMLIETDAPFLTPKPFRGTLNEPKHVILVTQFLSELRGESQALLAKQTTKNAKQLFNL